MNNNNGFRPQGGQGWNQSNPQYQGGNSTYNSNFSNQPSLKDLMLGQAQINENLTKKLPSNDKTLESINSKIEGLTSSLKNQLRFNKMLETQLTQIATTIPAYDSWKILG
jgi:hypothetical protein